MEGSQVGQAASSRTSVAFLSQQRSYQAERGPFGSGAL